MKVDEILVYLAERPTPATPTVLLVDRSRKIVKAWLGQLPSSIEQELFGIVEAL